jgi:mono/diheme cytochrome c family protein
MIDPNDPTHSRLIEKPRADVAHGGGRRILPGSPEEAALLDWIALVTAPGCDLGSGGGGGGGGGGGTGAELYATHCASCHGADARGLDGRPDVHCSRSIGDAVRNGRTGPAGEMPPVSALGDAQIALVQEFLLSLCPVGGPGDQIYASNCGTCHGPDGGGSATAPSVRCATRVDDALALGRGTRMPAFPALAPADVTSVKAFLAERCDAAGRTPADLYAGNCSTCHGAGAAGGENGLGVHGPDIRCTESGDYREKVRFGDDDMPAFPALDTADADAIAGWVRGTLCPGG